MADRYLFRGFNKDENGIETIYLNGEEIKGEWVYGSLIYKKCWRDNGMPEIYYKDWEEIYAYIYENNAENNIEEYPTKFIELIPETVGQYIGLDDKNGKKIFEGNIVNIEYQQTTVKNATIEYHGASFYGCTYSDMWELDDYCEVEVIGTIFDEKEVR